MSTEQTIEMTTEEWIAAHPEVTEAAPVWANRLNADDDGVEGNVALSFDRLEGSVEIGSAATWSKGEIIQNDPGVYVYFQENEARVTAEDLRRYANDFLTVAASLDGETNA